MTDNIHQEILEGINAELSKASEYVEFRIAGSECAGTAWKVFVNLDESGFRSGGLDESMEGSRAWWPSDPINGGAEVLSVIPEEEQINLRFAACRPPGEGGTIRIYPPKYLETLRDAWSDAQWAKQCLDMYSRVVRGANSFEPSNKIAPSPHSKPPLRSCQSLVFSLSSWDFGYLWGPPGTGKTTTLGALLAAYLVQHPTNHVLLLSTTNHAVDQALVAVDKSLEHWAARDRRAAQARNACFRLGNHFQSRAYENRDHLIPVKDVTLLRRLAELESKEPDKSDVLAYNEWARLVDAIRQEVRSQSKEVIQNARLAAMTTTRAVFTLDVLREFGPYDLIVFDEASQVGQAHAMALMPLGRRVIFAGDPQQLAPIVTSITPEAVRWLGESMFREMKPSASSTVLLNEQSRMAEPICCVISDVFYEGKLVVAADCKKNPVWLAERKAHDVSGIGSSPVEIVMVPKDGTWSPKFRGPIRYESATKICELVGAMVPECDESDILVLTPFRAQRTLIRYLLRQAGLRKVGVSTVHQGSERYAIVFDPVMASSDFLKTADATRLINVALSRAKARLILCLSPDDFQNSLITKVVRAIDQQGHSKSVPIEILARHESFPENSLGMVVMINSIRGRVVGFPGSTKLQFLDASTGRNELYMIDTLKAHCRTLALQSAPNKSEGLSKGQHWKRLVDERNEVNEVANAFWKSVEIGQQFNGTIKMIKNCSSFIDLGGR